MRRVSALLRRLSTPFGKFPRNSAHWAIYRAGVAVEGEELRNRLRAAQALAGIRSVDELAERIGIEGLGRDTLYDMQRGKRPIRRHELREIADACGLPYEFFTVDFATLSTGATENELQKLRADQEAIHTDITTALEYLASMAGRRGAGGTGSGEAAA